MTDREKVIRDLEQCLDDSIVAVVPADTVRDAIAMLKAQTQTIEQFEREREQQMWNMPPIGGFHDD